MCFLPACQNRFGASFPHSTSGFARRDRLLHQFAGLKRRLQTLKRNFLASKRAVCWLGNARFARLKKFFQPSKNFFLKSNVPLTCQNGILTG
jgi:hypothetical protein